MNYKWILVILFVLPFCENVSGQEKLYFNRIHYFEHQYCQHPIGTVIEDKVFYANNTNNTSFLNFNNSQGDFAFVGLTNYGQYVVYNQFLKNYFLSATLVAMGVKQSVPAHSKSINEARSRFRLDKTKDSLVNNKTLKHIKIVPKDTLVHRFESYNVLINTNVETELPLFTSPTVFFLLQGSLEGLKGTVVETYFVDLQGYVFCKDVLTGFQVTNKRVTVN